MDDRKLLRAFAATRSADAFAEIVRANVGIVYAAARRQLRDSTLAEDVTQAVFLLLSQKPRSVKGSIAGWLIVATRYACLDALKLAHRREKHERRAAEMKPIAAPPNSAESEWQEYAPHLDAALASLSAGDRDVIALRFLRGLKLAEIAGALEINPKAAERRLGRALDRLRSILLTRAATPVAEALAAQLSDRAAPSAPATLVQSIAKNAPPDSSSSSSMIARFARQSMRRSKLKMAAGILLGAGIVGASVASALILTRQSRPTPVALQSPAATPFAAAFPDARPGPAGVAEPGPLTLADLLQCVQARDALLGNCAYDLTKAGSTLSINGKSDILNTWKISVRRNGELFWMHQTTFKADGKLEADGLVNWDGKVSRVTAFWPTMPNPDGGVFPDAGKFWRFAYDDAMLEFYWKTFQDTPRGPHTEYVFKFASEWLGDAVASHDAKLRWLPGGLAVVTVGQGRPNQFRRVVFDTAKGCAPIRFENRYVYRGYLRYETEEATRMERVSGVWIASSVLVHSGSNDYPAIETQYRNTIANFTVGKTTDADLALHFSPGMQINDEVAGVAYLIGADGVLKQLPYEDEKTGRLTAGAVLTKPPTSQRFDAVTSQSDTAR